MADDDTFHALIRRVRAGDEDAAAQVVRRYEPAIRRLVRMKLTDPRLTRYLDSVDVCQSVMANFFVRMAAGQFELNTPDQLLKLLSAIGATACSITSLGKRRSGATSAGRKAPRPWRRWRRGSRRRARSWPRATC